MCIHLPNHTYRRQYHAILINYIIHTHILVHICIHIHIRIRIILGLSKDGSSNRMGTRSKRFMMVVEEGVVRELRVDEAGLDQSSADSVLRFIARSCSTK